MADFENIVQWLIYQEDDRRIPGKIVNLDDGAGFTRLGITSRNFQSYVPTNFFSSLPFADAVVAAKQVYRTQFWNRFSGDQISSDDVAATLLSFSVNKSVPTAVKMLQEVLQVPLIDGSLGPKTLAELNSKDAATVAKMFRAEWASYYHKIVDANPSDQRFLDGWLARVDFPYPSPLVGNRYR